ncbi:hypothetical protein BY458DRAFT_495936, partial [Sporodiniella umbellata]
MAQITFVTTRILYFSFKKHIIAISMLLTTSIFLTLHLLCFFFQKISLNDIAFQIF